MTANERSVAIEHLRKRITDSLAVMLIPKLARLEALIRADERERVKQETTNEGRKVLEAR